MAYRYLTLGILVLFLSSCGGGSSSNPAGFSGIWTGKLSGTNCENNQPVVLDVTHQVWGAGDELGAKVELEDQAGNYYEGIIQIGYDDALGFALNLIDAKVDAAVASLIRYDRISGSSAEVEARYSIVIIAPYGCNYTLYGRLSKQQ